MDVKPTELKLDFFLNWLNIAVIPCSVIMEFAYHGNMVCANDFKDIARHTILNMLSFKANPF